MLRWSSLSTPWKIYNFSCWEETHCCELYFMIKTIADYAVLNFGPTKYGEIVTKIIWNAEVHKSEDRKEVPTSLCTSQKTC